MPQLTAKTSANKEFRYMTFEIMKNRSSQVKMYTLMVNPEEFSQDEPAKVAITKTLGGAYVEDWGRDLIHFSIRGTTGYQKRKDVTGKETDGFQAFKELRADVYRYFLEPGGTPKQLSGNKDTYELRFYNWEDEEYYAVQPVRFSLMRSKSRPLLYAYEFEFVGLYPVGAGKKPNPADDKVAEAITNPTTALNNTQNNLAAAVQSVELTYEENYYGNQNLVDKEDSLTNTNFPGIADINDFFPKLKAIMDFSRSVMTGITDFQSGATERIDVYVADIKETVAKMQALRAQITALPTVPNHLLKFMSDAQAELALLTSFPQLLKR